MAATMHNQDDEHQPLNEGDGVSSFAQPAWVKLIKLASLIMGFMIIAGLALLVYGLSAGIGKLAERSTADSIFTFPQDMIPVSSSAGTDGTILFEFEDANKTRHIIHVDPQSKTVISKITLNAGELFGFVE
jgi:hypothetical protein